MNIRKLKESETVELKKSTSELKEAIISIVSILNKHQKGKLIFGIKTNGEVIGQTVTEKTIRDISKTISDKIEPKIFPKIKELMLDGKKCVLVEFSGSDKPYYAYGRVYIRVGDEDKKLSSQELEKLILKKNKDKLMWDKEICKEAVLKDINTEKVGWFVRKAKKQRDLDLEEDLPMKEVLMRLKLLKDGNFTNAAILLFGKKPKFLQSEVKCIRFSGNEPVKPYIDFQTLDGNIFDLINKAEDFVLRNIKKAIWLVPGQIQREEKYDYPSDAIREAIVNAIAHRDYESPSKVQIRIFDDYLEIWNPGKLPEGWTIKKLKQRHESVPKNPLLFKQLFWVKYVEDVGGGTLDMINKCKEWGIPEPEFEDTGTSIVIIFRKSIITEKLMDELRLNERQKKSIKHLKKHKRITTKEYCKLFDIVKDTANRDLKDLLNKKLIEKKGSGPKVYYILSTVRYCPILSDKAKKGGKDV